MKPDDEALPPAPGPSGPPSGPSQDPAAFFRQLGEQTSKVLTAAEEAARDIRDQARRDAAGVLAEARMQAEELARAAAAERRIAEEELRRFREARAILANQIEDVRRRLEEIILRLRTPVDAPDTGPAKPESRTGRAATPAEGTRPAQVAEGAEAGPAEEAAPKRAPTEAAATPVPAPASVPAGPAPEAPPAAAPVAAAPPAPPPAAPPGGPPEPPAAAPPRPAGGALLDARRAGEATREPGVRPGTEPGSVAPAIPEPPAHAAAITGEAAAMVRAEELTAEKSRRKGADGVQERLEAVPTPAAERVTPAGDANRQVAKNGTATIEPPIFEPLEQVADDLPPDSPYAEAFRRRVEALGDIPLAAARSLKRLLQEDQNDLLDRIRRSRGRGSFDDILPAEVQLDRFGDGMRTVLEPAFLRGRSLGGAPNIGESPDPVGSLVAKQVVAPLRRDLARMIEPRLAAGDTAATVSERAGDVYRVWKGVRTELLGEGLAFAAFHHGLLEAWREGHVAGKRWVMSPDEADCPKDICRTNEAAGLVALDASFPSGHLAPPAHGACSCTVIAPAR